MRKFGMMLFAALIFVKPVAAKETLTIYTYDSFTAEWGPGPQVKAAFEASCDCEINYVALADGVAMLNRLKAEGKDTKADVVLGLDTNLTAEAQATGLFAAHGFKPNELKLPGGWSDAHFLPFDYGYFAIVYDSEVLAQPPKSLREFVEGDVGQKIIIQDPRTSTPGLGLLLWVKQIYGDDAPKAWEKLAKRVLTITPGWSEAYGLFLKGEAPMVLSYTTSPAYHRIAEGSDKYKAARFSEGHYMQVEVAGMIAGSPREALARKFLQFMLSEGFQDIIPQSNWMLPAAATSSPLPEAFQDAEPGKALLFTPEEIAAKRREWTDEWLTAMGK